MALKDVVENWWTNLTGGQTAVSLEYAAYPNPYKTIKAVTSDEELVVDGALLTNVMIAVVSKADVPLPVLKKDRVRIATEENPLGEEYAVEKILRRSLGGWKLLLKK